MSKTPRITKAIDFELFAGVESLHYLAARVDPVIIRFLCQTDTLEVKDPGAPLAAQHVTRVVTGPAVAIVLHLLVLRWGKGS